VLRQIGPYRKGISIQEADLTGYIQPFEMVYAAEADEKGNGPEDTKAAINQTPGKRDVANGSSDES